MKYVTVIFDFYLRLPYMYANDATNSGLEDVSDDVLFGIVLFCSFQQFGIPTMKLRKN